MADRTLSFDSTFTVTVNGVQVSSPYTLRENCTIVASTYNGDRHASFLNNVEWINYTSPVSIKDDNVSFTSLSAAKPGPGGATLTVNYTAATQPSIPTPDWANSFVKTSAGNKAVQKVWIKQNGQLVTVYEAHTPVPSPVSFATDSWETISAACKDGSYKTVYSVGDTKDITLSTGEVITFAIMGFDHDDLSDGSGKAPITLGMTELLTTTYRMNASATNAGGWDESEMRTSTMQTLFGQIPSDLQALIKSVDKKATSGSDTTTITTSSDKLFLFSEVEIDGTTSSGYASEGEQYEYWKTVKDGKTSTDRIKYLSNGGGSAYGWWLRSPYLSSSSRFRYNNQLGYVTSSFAYNVIGVCFGFCVG